MKRLKPYIPGIILFLLALVIGMLVYQDYGIAWDEPAQRDTGKQNYDYVFHNDTRLFGPTSDHHGAAFELTLLEVENWLKITDSRDIYLARHLASHIFFLIGMLFGYVLIYRLFRSQFLACLGFVMLLCNPRIYAHSFINSKDTPFLALAVMLFALIHMAFEKRSTLFFTLAGLVCGYATGIRVMGVMFAGIILLFLLADLVLNIIRKREKRFSPLLHASAFLAAFSLSLYISWPFLWRSPVRSLIDSYTMLSHFPWSGLVLFNGKLITGPDIPWSYFPVWFLISNPPLWLIAGFCGIAAVIVGVVRSPASFTDNTLDRNFVLYLLCFFGPVLAVILLHSIIYDDWRHLYFVYPAFVLMALYFINKLLQTRYKTPVIAACLVQLGFTGYFMIRNHPFEQVYFNSFVSHKQEYLRKNYDLEYWGCGFKQGLEHLAAVDQRDTIRLLWSEFDDPLTNNIMILQPRDRKRMKIVYSGADYFITDFRIHPAEYPFPAVEYSVKALNSTILCVYKTH